MCTSTTRKLGCLQRIEQRHRRERVSRRVDDDPRGLLARLVDQVDELAFMVALPNTSASPSFEHASLQRCSTSAEGGAPVDVRLAFSQQVEVGTVENVDRLQRLLRGMRRRWNRRVGGIIYDDSPIIIQLRNFPARSRVIPYHFEKMAVKQGTARKAAAGSARDQSSRRGRPGRPDRRDRVPAHSQRHRLRPSRARPEAHARPHERGVRRKREHAARDPQPTVVGRVDQGRRREGFRGNAGVRRTISARLRRCDSCSNATR